MLQKHFLMLERGKTLSNPSSSHILLPNFASSKELMQLVIFNDDYVVLLLETRGNSKSEA